MSDRTEQLRRNLETALDELYRKKSTIKDLEIAFQEEIENIYTDTPWWKVTNYWDIFNALFFEDMSAEEVIDIIVSKAEEYEKASSNKELEESKSLNEKIPADLAQAYKRGVEYRRGKDAYYLPDLNDRRGELDFENTDYIEITPEEAEEYRRKGEADKLRVIYWGNAYMVDPRSFKLKPSAGIKPEDEYITRTGRSINTSNYVPFSHMMEIADKIYYTNEGDVKRSKRNSDEWDSGNHSTFRNEKSTLKSWESSKDVYEKQLRELEDKWEEGDISRKAYEAAKERLLDYIKYWRTHADKQRFSIRKQAREYQDEYITKLIRKAVDSFYDLKNRLKRLERESQWRAQEVDDAKSGTSYYQYQVKQIKDKIQVLQNELAYYEKIAGAPEIEVAENKLSKTLKEIEETKKQLDDLLKRKPDVKETGELEESREHKVLKVNKKIKSKRGLKESSIGNELAKYQRWVDYDMKRYGEISDKTKEELKDAGLELVKDQYGDYEVIAKDK